MLKNQILMAVSATLGMALSSAVMAYHHIQIHNPTGVWAWGYVEYVACSKDKYVVSPHSKWDGPYRGLCLVKHISVWVDDAVGEKGMGWYPPYSTGTGDSQFRLIWVDRKNRVLMVEGAS